MERFPATPSIRGIGPFVKIGLSLLYLITMNVARAEDLSTTTGQTFHDIQILSRTSSALLIRSAEGEVQIPLSELKPADRGKYSKSLINAMDLPAVTVIGDTKPDFTAEPERSNVEVLMDKEYRRQEEEKRAAEQNRGERAPVPLLRVTQLISFVIGSTNPWSDSATQPDYLTPAYQRLSPEIVEKDLKVFKLSLQQQ